MSSSQPSAGRAALLGAVFAIACSGLAAAAVPPYCEEAERLDPPEEVLASPRPDEVAEMLALHWSAGAAADSDLYAKIHDDLEIIRTLSPPVGVYAYLPASPSSLIFTAEDPQVVADMKSGLYTDWSCLNLKYEVDFATYWIDLSAGSLGFNGIYNAQRLVDLYAQLPRIDYVELNQFVSSVHGSCRYEDLAGLPIYFLETVEFIFPASITLEVARVAMTDPPQVERWIPPATQPAWLVDYEDCKNRAAGEATLFRDGFESGGLAAWSVR